ncbi:nucleoside 2-deoxyribosyltransferase [Burkholderia pseudomallei]|uniref:nucleoside 2-deoxyribosyltransferase n=1 Tax=Burkholderia pseudomallei TaxID=28450 RepID=UPI000F1B68A0|nr:nucleoside 2-deoxyribosyltransferase [Burkholderia pseudomallei]VBE96308.1 Nucleoside 2-deoxyribosyltransferase [Burkholderia pseudomallei]
MYCPLSCEDGGKYVPRADGPYHVAAVVFAILDGLDAGTIFEVGYARSKNIPVYALAQAVNDEDLKMVVGTDCKLFFDFVTALHHTAWKA